MLSITSKVLYLINTNHSNPETKHQGRSLFASLVCKPYLNFLTRDPHHHKQNCHHKLIVLPNKQRQLWRENVPTKLPNAKTHISIPPAFDTVLYYVTLSLSLPLTETHFI
jgi:hypothetical protein